MLEEELDGEMDDTLLQTSLSAHIQTVFQLNKDARQTSGIEEKMLQSLRAYNGHYDPEDLQKIASNGGSNIYMNITPTKCRAAMSWIRDIFMPAGEQIFSFYPTPLPDVPKEISERIRAEIDKYIQVIKSEEADPNQQKEQDPTAIATKLHEANQLQDEIEEAIQDEIFRVATKAVKKFEDLVADRLVEGEWDNAFSEFIEDFCVFPVAIMKGPIISKRRGLTWKNGVPTPIDDYIYLNRRVSPLDIYPAPDSTRINEGNLCEHIRLQRKDLYNLIGVDGYKEDHIRTLLEENRYGVHGSWMDSSIEQEKVEEEFRGDSTRANQGVFHGVHYHGSASWTQLKEWGYTEEVLGTDEAKEFEVEAIVVGSHVIKCVINDDPLLRRPYYKSSFQNIPGSWWGRSLPELMRDIQRMCNATARALSNNMGLASGPQIEVNIDRLAADETIDDIYPFKIWQTTNDPTGSGGKAITFFQPSSNAAELLAVYKEFEVRADDATGIPRYAYGNENTGGAAQTASGLSMLLESASKGIKDAIRHIDDGLVKPRVEYQFYWEMITNPELGFTGDIKVVAKGSQTLTMRATQEARRNEFLQILAAPVYANIIGNQGLADILREMSKSLGLGENIVPSKIALRVKQKQEEKLMQQQMQMQQQAAQEQQAVGIKQVEMQTNQAESSSRRTAELKAAEIQLKAQNEEADRQVKLLEIQQREAAESSKNMTALQKQEIQAAQKDRDTNKNLALSVQSNFTDKSNLT